MPKVVPIRGMEIFITWSGERSRVAAEALGEWLPNIVNEFDPFVSTAMDKGARWPTEIAARLEQSKAGIICLTPHNLQAEWLLFEAGALSRVTRAYVCTLLIGLEHSQVQWPLAQFQHTKFNKTDVFKLLTTLNSKVEKPLPEQRLQTAFEKWWPELEENFRRLPAEGGATPPKVTPEQKLDEVLGVVRELSRVPSQAELLSSASLASIRDQLSREVHDQFLRDIVMKTVAPFDPKAQARLERVGQVGTLIVASKSGFFRFDIPENLQHNNLLRDLWVDQVARKIRDDA